MTRSPNANLNRDRSKRKSAFDSCRKDEATLPGPTSYKGVDDKWGKMSPYKKEPVYSIPKKKASSYLDEAIKNKKNVPGVAKYSDSITVYDKITRGPSPHYKRGR